MQHYWGCFGKFTRDETRELAGSTTEWFCAFSRGFPEQLKSLFQSPSGTIFHSVKSLQLTPELHKAPILFLWGPEQLQDSPYYALGYLKVFPDVLQKDAFRMFFLLLPQELYETRFNCHAFHLFRGGFFEHMWNRNPMSLTEADVVLPQKTELPKPSASWSQLVEPYLDEAMRGLLVLKYGYDEWQRAHSVVECLFSCASMTQRKRLSLTSASGVGCAEGFAIVGVPGLEHSSEWSVFADYPAPVELDVEAMPDAVVLEQLKSHKQKQARKSSFLLDKIKALPERLGDLRRFFARRYEKIGNRRWALLGVLVLLSAVVGTLWVVTRESTPQALANAVDEIFAGEGEVQRRLEAVVTRAREEKIVIPSLQELERMAQYQTTDRARAEEFWREICEKDWSAYRNVSKFLRTVLRKEQRSVLDSYEEATPQTLPQTQKSLYQLEQWKKLWRSLPLAADIPPRFSEVEKRYRELELEQRQRQLLAAPPEEAILHDLQRFSKQFLQQLDQRVTSALKAERQPLPELKQSLREVLLAEKSLARCRQLGADSRQFLSRWQAVAKTPLENSKEFYGALEQHRQQWRRRVEKFAQLLDDYRGRVQLPRTLEEFTTAEVDYARLSSQTFAALLELYQRLLIGRWGEWQSHQRQLFTTDSIAQFRASLRFLTEFSVIEPGFSFFDGKDYETGAEAEEREVLDEVYHERQKQINIFHLEFNFAQKRARHEALVEKIDSLAKQWQQVLLAAVRDQEIPPLSWPEGEFSPALIDNFEKLVSWLKEPREAVEWEGFAPDFRQFLECYRQIGVEGYSHQAVGRLLSLTSLYPEQWYREYLVWLTGALDEYLRRMASPLAVEENYSYEQISELNGLYQTRRQELLDAVGDLERLQRFSEIGDQFTERLAAAKELVQKYGERLAMVEEFQELRKRFDLLPSLSGEKLATLSKLIEEHEAELLFRKNPDVEGLRFRLYEQKCDILRGSGENAQVDKSLAIYRQHPFLEKIPEIKTRYERLHQLAGKTDVAFRVFDDLPQMVLSQQQLQDLLRWCEPHRPSSKSPSLLKNSPEEIRRLMFKLFRAYVQVVFNKYLDEPDVVLVHRSVLDHKYKKIVNNIQQRSEFLFAMKTPETLPQALRNFVETQKKALADIHFDVKYSVFGGFDFFSVDPISLPNLKFQASESGEKVVLRNVQVSYTTKLLGSFNLSWYPFRSQQLQVRTSLKGAERGEFSSWPFIDAIELAIPHQKAQRKKDTGAQTADITLVIMPLEVDDS